MKKVENVCIILLGPEAWIKVMWNINRAAVLVGVYCPCCSGWFDMAPSSACEMFYGKYLKNTRRYIVMLQTDSKCIHRNVDSK